MSGRERLMTVVTGQRLHDAAAAGYERRRRSRRAESGLVSQPRRGVSAASVVITVWPRDRGRDDVEPRHLQILSGLPTSPPSVRGRRECDDGLGQRFTPGVHGVVFLALQYHEGRLRE
jgi:hypothetical protein